MIFWQAKKLGFPLPRTAQDFDRRCSVRRSVQGTAVTPGFSPLALKSSDQALVSNLRPVWKNKCFGGMAGVIMAIAPKCIRPCRHVGICEALSKVSRKYMNGDEDGAEEEICARREPFMCM